MRLSYLALSSAVLLTNGAFADLSVYGEFLYWKAIQDQTEYAGLLPGGVQTIIRDISFDPSGNLKQIHIDEKISIVEPNFDFKPGFRVGALYKSNCSMWDVELFWTHLDEKISSSVSDKGNGVISLAFPAANVAGFVDRDPSAFGFASEGSSVWDFEFNTIDLQFGRNICCFEDGNFHPYLGVRAALIRQTQHITFLGLTAGSDANLIATSFRKNQFWGVGPSFGFDSSWTFVDSLSLSGGLSGALLCGNFDAETKPLAELSINTISLALVRSDINRVRPTVDGYLGFDWSCPLAGCFQIDVGVYYEVEYFWNQWQAPNDVVDGILSSGTSPQGDLTLHGLTVKLGVTF